MAAINVEIVRYFSANKTNGVVVRLTDGRTVATFVKGKTRDAIASEVAEIYGVGVFGALHTAAFVPAKKDLSGRVLVWALEITTEKNGPAPRVGERVKACKAKGHSFAYLTAIRSDGTYSFKNA